MEKMTSRGYSKTFSGIAAKVATPSLVRTKSGFHIRGESLSIIVYNLSI